MNMNSITGCPLRIYGAELADRKYGVSGISPHSSDPVTGKRYRQIIICFAT